MDLEIILSIFMIIGIDLILGGDNAIVIALACRNLPEKQRTKAILFGTFLAVLCRIILTVFAVFLLQIPFVTLIGGIFLVYIAFSLMTGVEDNPNIKSHHSLWKAIQTIVIADLVMGMDNVIAIAGAANGHIYLIIFGLFVSVPIIIWGSHIILKLMNRFPILIYAGGSILAYTAGKMVANETLLQTLFHNLPIHIALPYLFTVFILFSAIYYNHMTSIHK